MPARVRGPDAAKAREPSYRRRENFRKIGGIIIERSLFAFIWKYSKREQVILLVVTLTLFPLLYLTLELPKQIINGAIDSDVSNITIDGVTFSQVEYLMVLSGAFLIAVLCHGLLKMRINTMKGVLSERLLRRFRYTLIARILRFPQPYFERTSQGELVSMVTAESEPMGGLMGDALAQPVLQAGQMLTILGFLFAQSFTFGMAACALIPLQAWLIPKLQRQVNLLNRKRVIEIRALAAEIGEGAAGAGTLTSPRRLALPDGDDHGPAGRLFTIRLDIYQKKFFMKFINNFITQLTPFLFYSLGGYLVIRGSITLGALVAALAAYKELSSPWKELLDFYNQSADMSLRWETITERFAPPGMVDERLMSDEPDEIPRLTGDIELDGVTVRDADGNSVLETIDTVLPGGGLIGITAPNDEDRRALSEVITRELLPSSGTVRIGGHDVSDLHQITIATRIGHANSRPVLFQGSFGDNVLMPIRYRPMGKGTDAAFAEESVRAGNSTDMLSADWIDPARGEADSAEALRDYWCELVERIGGSDALMRRALDQKPLPDLHADLMTSLIALRPQVAEALREEGLSKYVFRLDPDEYCVALPVVQNLLFATPRTPLAPDLLAQRPDYVRLLQGLNIVDDLVELAIGIMEGLRQIFGSGGTDHPLFLKTGLDPALYDSVLNTMEVLKAGKPLDDRARALLLSVPSSITAEQMGAAFSDRIRTRILELRKQHGEALRTQMSDLFSPIEPDGVLQGLSVLENAIYGKLSEEAGPRGEDVRHLLIQILNDTGITGQVLRLVFDVPIALGGANLPAAFAEPLAVSRAVIKRPDIIILDCPMVSFAAATRAKTINTLRSEFPATTIVHLAPELENDVEYDMTLELDQGRITGAETTSSGGVDGDVAADLARKLQALEKTALFSGLDRKQLRLLAFGARWYQAAAGHYVFHKNDPPDRGAFMMIEGEADLLLPRQDGEDHLIATVGKGTLVGELGLIRNEPRALDMRARTDILCLRLGVAEFLAVVENDAATAFKLLQVVAGYVKT